MALSQNYYENDTIIKLYIYILKISLQPLQICLFIRNRLESFRTSAHFHHLNPSGEAIKQSYTRHEVNLKTF